MLTEIPTEVCVIMNIVRFYVYKNPYINVHYK